jgi:asparagine synthase (glutamine-hydrolysing)
MCGIAGVIDLAGQRPAPPGMVEAMAAALYHRGPDEDGFLSGPSLSLASRRLSIVGLADGRQPIYNEDRSIAVVYNGELFDYPETRARLEGRGHRFTTHCDTELIPHLWEEHGEGMFERLRGQFAVALWDRGRRLVVLGRDRFGICPLFWARRTGPHADWLLFASEIKALLASGLIEPRPDPRGLNHVFTFFALPGAVTCFAGVNCLLPGHYLGIQQAAAGEPARVTDRTFWELDFPDWGQEEAGGDAKALVDRFEQLMVRAVERRLRADVPVVSYLSGGVDSSLVVALSSRALGRPVPTFTIQVKDPALDEAAPALRLAQEVGSKPTVVGFGAAEVLRTYPGLIRAAEGPVIDTSCAALLMLAREVHRQGYKVALTGEGADEWLAGYPWYKVQRFVDFLDAVPGLRMGQLVRRLFLRWSGAPRIPPALIARSQRAIGGDNAWLNIFGLMSLSKLRFFSPAMLRVAWEQTPYADLGLNLERMRRWHPFNRALCLGARVMLAGHLLASKGDRVAMNSSVETRYPFLDEDVCDFLAPLHPRWKLHGLCEKYLLKRLAERWLPRDIAWRRKAMFRAPLDSFQLDKTPPFVEQLLSSESLRKTGYFVPQAVQHWRQFSRTLRPGSSQRVSVEMGLVGVVSTQLWHHTFIDGSLADLPSLKIGGFAKTGTGLLNFRSPVPVLA